VGYSDKRFEEMFINSYKRWRNWPLMKLFDVIRNKREFQQHGKNALIQQIYKGKGNQRESSNYTGISPLPIFRKINLAIRTLRVREWLLHHKNWPCLGQDLLKKKGTVDNMFQLNHVLINTWDKKVAHYMAVLFWNRMWLH